MHDQRNQSLNILKNIFLFSSIEDWRLSKLAAESQNIDLLSGERLFMEGDSADALYIVMKGKIQVSMTRGKKRRKYATLIPGDFFGEDFLVNPKRTERAIALGETSVLKIPKPSFLSLADEIPELKEVTLTTARSRKFVQKKIYKWLAQDESVYFITRRHAFFLSVKLFFPLVLATLLFVIFGMGIKAPDITLLWTGVIGLLVTLGISAWIWLDWSNDIYVVTSKRVFWIEKMIFLYERQQEVPLITILSTDVRAYQSLRMLIDYGTLTIKTYTGAVTMQRIRSPARMIMYINNLQSRIREMARQSETEEMEVVLRERLGFQEPGSSDAGYIPKTAPAQPDKGNTLGQLIASMLGLRYEQSDRITYRKHWFVLFRKIWIQSLLLIVLLVILYFLWKFSLISPFSSGFWVTFFVIVVGFWFYQYVDWRNDIYVVTLEQIMDIERKPLGRETKMTAPLDNILSLEHTRLGIFGLLFNFGTVTINVGTEKLQFFNVYNPAQVQYEIFSRMSALRQRKEHIEAAKERERIADWLTIYHKQSGSNREDNDTLNS